MGLFYPGGEFRSDEQIMRMNAFPDKKEQSISFEGVASIIQQAREAMTGFEIGQKEATWLPPHRGPIVLAMITDMHFGSMVSNSKLLQEHFDLIENTPGMFAVFNGDDVDNFNATGKWAMGMMENPLPPQIVARAMAQRLQKLDEKGKIAAMGFGNHNDFGVAAGQDWYDSFLGKMHCPILTTGGLVHIQHQEQKYDLAMTHKYWGTSKLNPTNACKRFLDFEYPDADIVFLGHTHQSEGLQFEKGGKDRVACIGGTYKDDDRFARTHGIGGRSGSPGWAVALYPDSRKMQLFKDMRLAAEFLK